MINLFKTTNDNNSYVELGAPASGAPASSAPVSGATSPAKPALPCERSEQSSISIRPKGGTINVVSSTSNRPKDDNYSDLVQATGVPPKIFQSSKRNIHRIPNDQKNRFDPRKKIQTRKVAPVLVAPPPEAITEQSTIRIHEGEEKGKPFSAWIDHPEWAPRRRSPYLRGADANRKAIETINANVQSKKPDLTYVPFIRGMNYEWGPIEKDALDHVASGGTLASYCKFSGVRYPAMMKHLKVAPEFKAFLKEARRQGADALAAEALEIASTPMLTEETIEVYDKNDELVNKSVKKADNVHARKLAFQARMSLLEKWAPEKYGPNVEVESGGMADKLRAAQLRIRQANKESLIDRSRDVEKAISGGTPPIQQPEQGPDGPQ